MMLNNQIDLFELQEARQKILKMMAIRDRVQRQNIKLRRIAMATTILWIIMCICAFVMFVENRSLKEDYNDIKLKYDNLKVEYFNQDASFQEAIMVLEGQYKNTLHSTKDWLELVYTMQGEAGNQGEDGIMHCTSTVLNRLYSKHWGNTIHDVISASGQYQAYGITYQSVNDDVIKAVDKVLLYGPINNAYYYMNPDASSKDAMLWMRTKPFLFRFGSHEFYGEKVH